MGKVSGLEKNSGVEESLHLFEKVFGKKDLLISHIPDKYFYDESTLYNVRPEAVFLPNSIEKVVDFVKLAREQRVKIVPRGAGTGVCGGALAIYGGIVLSLERMTKILDIDETNMCASVEAGVINGLFKEELKRFGLYYPPDPQSYENSSIGGNIATNAGGPRAIKYGTTKDYVMSLTVVTGEGKIINTGGKVYKNSSGYNLNELFCGSEGTLGIILNATLNIIRFSEKKVFFLIPFRDIKGAMGFLSESIKEHLSFSAMEFLDDTAKNLVEIFLKRKLPHSNEAKCYLFIEYEGEKIPDCLVDIVEKNDGLELFFASDRTQEERLWEARKKIAYAVKDYAKHVYKADIVVPRGVIPDFVQKVKDFQRDGLIIACFGHIGDGNIHLNILDKDGDKEKEAGEMMIKIMDLVFDFRGFPSGEHGIGVSKKEFLKKFFSSYHINKWRAVKKVFDPLNIMNPGKIFD